MTHVCYKERHDPSKHLKLHLINPTNKTYSIKNIKEDELFNLIYE